MASTAGLAGVLAAFGADYLAGHALSASQAKAWRAITACRTEALGGHVECCDHCGRSRHVYHSCRNRHCPRCQTRAKEAWIAARRRELLPVPYFHLVFTLPHALHALVAAQPRLLYELLFGAASATLTEFAGNSRHLGGTPSFTLVLHTWKQDLGRHVHVHALVAGGALSPAGDWVHPQRGFLFPVKALSKVFRGKFVASLEAARVAGSIPAMAVDADWRYFKAQLYAHDWVVYAKQPLGGPAQVLEYLGRYTHRVAISNERIVAIADDGVRFRVRADPASGKKRTRHLPGSEFIRRFLLHVLPAGFKRIRHFGLLAPGHKARHLAAARVALAAPPPDAVVIESLAMFMLRVAQIDWRRCPHCPQGSLVTVAALAPQPSANASSRGPP